LKQTKSSFKEWFTSVDAVNLLKKTITREFRLNVLPIFYPNISYSLITKMPSLLFVNEAELPQINPISNK